MTRLARAQGQQQENSRQRVGLYFGQTGMPLFVLASTCHLPAEPMLLNDALQLPSLLRESTQRLDRLFLQAVEAFFASGGRELYVLAVHVATDDIDTEAFINAVLGSDGGFRQKTGVISLYDYDALCDLLVIPQASVLLDAERLGSFLRQLAEKIRDIPTLMLLADAPCISPGQSLEEWLKPFHHHQLSLFYPWVKLEGFGLIPASVLMASHIQRLDSEHNCAISPANEDIRAELQPVYPIEQREIVKLVRNRLNVLRVLPSGSLVLWGSATTAKGGVPESTLQIARSLSALRDAIERSCEPFLMEARTDGTCRDIEEALQSLLEYWHQRRLFANRSVERAFRVSCQLQSAASGSHFADAGIEVSLQLALDRAEDFIGLGINV